MTVNDSKFYPGYLNQFADECNNTYHCSIGKHLLMLIILLSLKKLRLILKLLNLKVLIESGLLSSKTFLAKVTPKIDQKKYLLIILC